MKRVRRRQVRALQRAQVAAREALERAYRQRIEKREEFRSLVTSSGGGAQPFHRWLPYRQGFSPGLVTRFLEQARLASGPILDPFSGSGTVVITCAQRGQPAIGLDLLPSLLLVTKACFGPPPDRFPDLKVEDDLGSLWKQVHDPPRRVALLLAAARTVDGEGRSRRLAFGPADLLARTIKLMRSDLERPLAGTPLLLRGDARRLPLAAGSVGGILTSPPYLSRYAYEKVNRPMETLLSQDQGLAREIRASRKRAAGPHKPAPEAAEEAARLLESRGDRRGARAVRGYCADMQEVLASIQRVLGQGAPLWMVVGGADWKREYLPMDLILAELAQQLGLKLEHLIEARRLRLQGRHLGGLCNMAPRESVLMLRRI